MTDTEKLRTVTEGCLDRLSFPDTTFEVTEWPDGRVGVQARCTVADAVTPGATRVVKKAMTIEGPTEADVAIAALKAVLRVLLHEAGDWFTFDGERVLSEHVDGNALGAVDVAIITEPIGKDREDRPSQHKEIAALQAENQGLRDLLAAIKFRSDEAHFARIEAQNPGIDMAKVREQWPQAERAVPAWKMFLWMSGGVRAALGGTQAAKT